MFLSLLFLTVNLLGKIYGDGVGELLPLNPSQSFMVTNGEMPYGFHQGDFNGDGFDDLVLRNYTTKTIYILFGKSFLSDIILKQQDWDSANGIPFHFEALSSFYQADALIGDFNNDGYDDLMVSDSQESPVGRYHAGCSYLILGTATGYASPNVTSSSALRIFGATNNEGSGYFLAPAGDFNNDGFDDVIIRTLSYSYGYVVFGTANLSGDIDLANLSPSQGVKVTAPTVLDTFRTVGDFNGDGYDDILLLNSYFVPTLSAKVYLVLGQATNSHHQIDLSTFADDGYYYGMQFFRSQGKILLGSDGAGIGDLNQDGFVDLIISAVDRQVGYHSTIYIVYGKPLLFPAGESLLQLDLDMLTSVEGVKITGSLTISYHYGSIGDLNGDGYPEIMLKYRNSSLYGLVFIYGGNDLTATDLDNPMTYSAERVKLLNTAGNKLINQVGDWNQDGPFELAYSEKSNGVAYTYVFQLPFAMTTAVPTAAGSSVPSPSPTASTGSDTDSEKSAPLSTGAIIGIAIGGAAVIALIIAGVIYYVLVIAVVVPSPSVPSNHTTAAPVVKPDYTSVQQMESSNIEMNHNNHQVAVVSNAEENL